MTTLPIPTVSPSPSPTASALPAELDDGRHFGFVRSVDAEAGTFVYDLAEFLTGEEANQAAVEDGAIEEGDSVPNDYYIRNQNPRLRTLTLAEDARIQILDWAHCCDEFLDAELESFAQGFEEDDPTGTYRGETSPYWVTVEDGVVTQIQEQYLP
jgi:hypothetical protein